MPEPLKWTYCSAIGRMKPEEQSLHRIYHDTQYGSFRQWLDQHHPKSKDEWVKIFKQKFRFTGGEIVNEFLLSTGYLPGAHEEGCKIYNKVLKARPAWKFL